MKNLDNKTAWITGAGSGIGRALALAMHKEGMQLILSGRKRNKLEETKALLDDPLTATILVLDLEQHDELEATLNQQKELLSRVDILVNNAGISQRSLTKDTQFSVYKRLMDINYLGTVKLSLHMLDAFTKKGSGHFVNISSSAGKFGVPLRTGYSASKFALHGFFEGLRAELKDTTIGITMVCPGFINTDISKNALTADGKAQGTMDQAQANGMKPAQLSAIVIRSIKANKAEVLVGGFKETKLAVWVSRIFPSVFRKIIANSAVT